MFQKRLSSTFIKAQCSSIVSTIADFLITHIFTEALGIWYLISSSMGTISGGCVNFYLGQYWVFKTKNYKKFHQVKRYVIVWAGSMVLNLFGLYLFTEIFKMHYMISKVLIAIIVGTSFNYYYQQSYVFKIQNEFI